MGESDPLGPVELAVLDAVHRGALRSRCTAVQVRVLREQLAGEAILHHVLRRYEREGLLHGRRDRFGRRYELTRAGRARLRAERRFRLAMVRAFVRAAAGSS